MMTQYEVKKIVGIIIKNYGERHFEGGGLTIEFWSAPDILGQFKNERTPDQLEELAKQLYPQVLT